MVKKASFGAGCFWGVEERFKKLKGVLSTRVGYQGGYVPHPTYQQVCDGSTGHAEVVELEYDPDQIKYEQLLDAFWAMHDPTSLNKQGADVGAQYRSIIFYYDEAQREKALASKMGHKSKENVVTEIVPAPPFYRAEEYHQCYLEKRKGA